MYLSKLLRDDYNYLAAMEAFEQSPVIGWLMQRVGAYSIIRGTVDRPSFQMTKRLLVAGKRWLVIFPEGQTVWQNSTVIPFQQGVIQLAFKAYEEAAKKEEDASLFCVPIAIKYVYLQDMHDEIDASLTRLESKLFASKNPDSRPRYERLRRVAEAMLVANEKKHCVAPDESSSMNDRIQNLKEHVVSGMEQRLDVTPPEGRVLLDRIRTLFNTVDRITREEPDASDYERQLALERQRALRNLYDDLWRALQFVAIYDGYVSESMTVERFMDVLCLLEMEVLKERRIWGPRKARVKFGDPVDLKDRFSSYKTNRRGAVEQITLALESSVRQMLDALGADCEMVRQTA
jgi:1-acyl-sn-glycerol-3-phosphate acyltransferase